MSSIRVAAISCVLAVALGAGAWGAAYAFPLYEFSQQPPPPPPPPARDPLSPEAYTRLASSYHDQLWRDRTLSESQTIELAGRGIAAADRALELQPNYADAMVWKSILLRMQATLAADSVERDRLINEANALREQARLLQTSGRAYVSRDAISAPPPPPPPPPPGRRGVAGGVPGGGVNLSEMVFMPASFERQLKDLNPVRIGGNIKPPAKILDVKPVYPPIAQQARVQGVVIIESIIDRDGNVVDARVLRSIPLLDQAALDAVRQWRFTPPHMDGMPTAVVMTVTVNFRVQ